MVTVMTTLYRLYLKRDGVLVGRRDFKADDAPSARIIAATIYNACRDECNSFELWENAYRIDAPIAAAAAMLGSTRQEQVVDTETALLDSGWAVAKSRRLLLERDEMRRKPLR